MPCSNRLSILLFTLAFLSLSAFAIECPPKSEIVYSPFKPWWYFYNGTAQRCWRTASCVFIQADEDETRKQQYGATALVMGLIPLTLRDIAWPEKRMIPVSKRPTFIVEMLVLALGLQPIVFRKGGNGDEDARDVAEKSSIFARWAWELKRRTVVLLVALTTVLLLVCYAGVALVEIYSKRSALACPFPVICLMWYVCGIVPGAIHACLSRLRVRWTRNWEEQRKAYRRAASNETSYDHERSALQVSVPPEHVAAAGEYDTNSNKFSQSKEGSGTSESKDQESEEWWIVQLVWAIYNIAGTLVFTSIMAVTVLELFVWVVVCFAATGASKMLAYFICLAFEDGI